MMMGTVIVGCGGQEDKAMSKKQSSQTSCDLYRSVNGSPVENLSRGKRDVVS